MTEEILLEKQQELLEKWKDNIKDTRRESLLKKEPRFLRRSTVFRLPNMGIADT